MTERERERGRLKCSIIYRTRVEQSSPLCEGLLFLPRSLCTRDATSSCIELLAVVHIPQGERESVFSLALNLDVYQGLFRCTRSTGKKRNSSHLSFKSVHVEYLIVVDVHLTIHGWIVFPFPVHQRTSLQIDALAARERRASIASVVQ